VTDDFDFTPWTSAGAARLRGAAEELAAAVREHAAAITAAKSHAEFVAVMQATERLMPILLSYADAQFAYTGNGFPFGALREYDEDEDATEEDADPGDDAPVASAGISVLQRHDYRVTDEAAVLAAGRAAYRRSWPDDTDSEAVADVTTLGNALYQIAHAEDWAALKRTEGLAPVGGWVGVVTQDEPLGSNVDQWPDDLFAFDADLLFEQTDTFHD
jgi:hypothetical protein